MCEAESQRRAWWPVWLLTGLGLVVFIVAGCGWVTTWAAWLLLAMLGGLGLMLAGAVRGWPLARRLGDEELRAAIGDDGPEDTGPEDERA